MTNDDRFDELLQEAAREHNRAPETPRAEMWAVIAAARGTTKTADAAPVIATAGARAAEAPRPVPVRVIPLYTRHRRTIGWVAGLAATLLVGVEIGRLSSSSSVTTPAMTVATAGPATNGAPVVSAPTGSPSAESSATAGASSATAPAPDVPTNGARAGNPASTVVSPRVLLAGRGESRGQRADGARESAREAEVETTRQAALPYRVAAMQHLVTTEALLVSLRSDVREGRKDTTIAVWAGQLLGTTRMLIDSPAGRDPQLKQLLDDLELVLAQISRLPGARGEAADLGIIDDAVRHRQIMTRLRALSPDT